MIGVLNVATNNPIRLNADDLFSSKVESYLEEQAALRHDMPEAEARPLLIRVIYSSYFYLSLAGAIGALVGWGILEGQMHDFEVHQRSFSIAVLLLFPTVAGFVGLFLGASEGLMCRNIPRALISSVVGLAVGFVGGLVILIPVGIVYSIMSNWALQIAKPGPGERLHGIGFLVLMMGRGAAWAIAAIPAGLGQGIALREKKVVVNGLLGAVLGGLLGGLAFDPIDAMFSSARDASVSRAVGFALIGIMVGLFVGLVEQWTKTAWLLMKAGPLTGKQFVLYRNPTVIGSAPKADIYIFKDPDIEPRHALLHNRGGRFELEDLGTKDGTYVNGVPVTKRILQAGDQIVIGKTLLEFSLKESN
jgi:hypothetical protein